MEASMKKICFINGSPRGEKAASMYFLNAVNNLLNKDKYSSNFADINKITSSEFHKVCNSDIIIISFPLYVFCLPGLLMNFLEEFHRFHKKINISHKNIRVYSIVNCGMQDPTANDEAIRVIRNFSNRLNFNWRFSISIALGQMFIANIKDEKMRVAYREVNEALLNIILDIENEDEKVKENLNIKPLIGDSPQSLYYGNMIWVKKATENSLDENELYRTPY